jgi:hypothetical protein
VAGVTGRTDLLRLSFAGAGLGTDALSDFFHRISGFDLVFGRYDRACGSVGLLLSTLEIPNPEPLRRDLGERFAGAVSMQIGLGAVSLIGFGLGSRPEALFDALRVLGEAGFEVLDSFTGRESLTFVMDEAGVQDGVRVLHRAFVESRLGLAGSLLDGAALSPASGTA